MGRTRISVHYVRAVPRMSPIIDSPPRCARRRVPPQDSRRFDPAAIYIGTMPGFQNLPAIELYNLLVPVGVHPVGSTVSRTTLEKHGFRVTIAATTERGRDGEMQKVDPRSLRVA
jgi:hypothetical protein